MTDFPFPARCGGVSQTERGRDANPGICGEIITTRSVSEVTRLVLAHASGYEEKRQIVPLPDRVRTLPPREVALEVLVSDSCCK